MWSGECETSKFGSSTIYQRRKGETTLIILGVLALIICCSPFVFICYQRRKVAVDNSATADVDGQINDLDFDLKSKMTFATDQDGKTAAVTIGMTMVTNKAETVGAHMK